MTCPASGVNLIPLPKTRPHHRDRPRTLHQQRIHPHRHQTQRRHTRHAGPPPPTAAHEPDHKPTHRQSRPPRLILRHRCLRPPTNWAAKSWAVIVDAPGIVTAAVAVAVALVGIADSRSGVRAHVLDTGRGGLATSDPPEEERGGAHARATAGSARELRRPLSRHGGGARAVGESGHRSPRSCPS